MFPFLVACKIQIISFTISIGGFDYPLSSYKHDDIRDRINVNKKLHYFSLMQNSGILYKKKGSMSSGQT